MILFGANYQSDESNQIRFSPPLARQKIYTEITMDVPSAECPSSGESSAAALYKDAMYKQAASELHTMSRKCQHADRSDSSKKRLRALAAEADALLCEVRSLTNDDLEYPVRCEYALKANRRYREALFGKLQELSIDQSTSVMDRRNIAVVESLLLALVSAVWLYAQTQKIMLARDIVLEDFRRLSPILSGLHGSGESLLTPRTEMFREIEKVVSSNSIAWRQLCHALRVLDFMLMNNEDEHASLPTCTAAPKPGNDDDDDAVDASLSQLGVRELLLEALRLDRRLRNDPQCPPVVTRRSRDQFLELAVSMEISASVAGESIAVRIKTLIHAVEIVGAEASNTDSSSRELASTLETQLGGNTSSAAAWNLLGCLKASYDVDGALKSFHKSHELDPTRRGRNPSQSATRLFVVNKSHRTAHSR